MEITVPFNFIPRHYQIPLFEARDAGYRFMLYLAHRRAGKDKTAINLLAKEMIQRVGTYFYIFPTYSQGRKILWNGMDGAGFKLLDHIPKEYRKRQNDQEMLIELKNGSILQVVGSDNIDSIVGTNPIGCVFSEYSLQNPQAFDFIEPILRENGGWSLFVYTPRGKDNHGYDLYKYALENPDTWWVLRLPATKTNAISKPELEEAKKRSVAKYGDDAIFNQEYLVSFEGSQLGSFYGEQLKMINANDQITDVPFDPLLPVYTVWDIGVSDQTAIWIFQVTNTAVHILDYEEHSGEGIPFYIQLLQKKPYRRYYEKHFWPHDGEVRDFSTGISRSSTAKKLGMTVTPLRRLPLQDGIQATRNMLPTCFFNKEKTKLGLERLSQYKKKWNEKTRSFSDKPDHNVNSHAADAARYLAQAVATIRKKDPSNKPKRKIHIPSYRKTFGKS